MVSKLLNPNQSKIAVIGGGNIGTQFACMCASKGYEVSIITSKPETYGDGKLEIVDEFERVTVGQVKKVTSKVEEAVLECDLVFVTYPAFMFKEVADAILPYVSSNMTICVIPGTGGAEFAFKKCIEAGATVCGLQRVPSVARLEKYGKRVRCEGMRSELFLAAIPSSKAKEMSEFMEQLWNISCVPLPNYLSVTLTPSNPILHTTRLKTLFSDYQDGKVYERNPLFYGEWNDASSELLIACDEELQLLCRKLEKLDLTNVKSLKIHYESETVQAMTQKISSIRSLHNLSSPMNKVEGGWIPDFESRYFTADFPYGLAIIEELGNILEVDIPCIKDTMNWYRNVTQDKNSLSLKEYGISSVEDIYNFYK